MIKKILCNTLAKKLAFFAVSFFVVGGGIAAVALSPSGGPGAIVHLPPIDITQVAAIASGEVTLTDAIMALTANVNIPMTEEAIEYKGQQEAAPPPPTAPADANVRAIPAIGPLQPHNDTLGFFHIPQIPLSYELQRYTFERSAALGLEYELVLALMWRESSFRVEAIGVNRNGTRDSGLLQINDVNRGWLRERYGIYNLMDPFQNIDAGTMILADLLSRYPEHQALVAYQFGEGGMLRMVGQGADTHALSAHVREKRYEYRQLRTAIHQNLQASSAEVTSY